jgi:hypothetical protein
MKHLGTLVHVRACDSGVEPAAKAHLLARPNCQLAYWHIGGCGVLCSVYFACASVHTVGLGEENESLILNVSKFNCSVWFGCAAPL